MGGAVKDQVCSLVGDNRLSSSDITTLSSLLDKADAAGLDSEVLQPVRDIVGSGEAKAADLQALQDACP